MTADKWRQNYIGKEGQPLTASKRNAEFLQVASAFFSGRKCWRLPFTSELLIKFVR